MNKLLKFAVAAIAAVAAQGATAQLVINSNGTAHFGDTAVVDTAATVHVAGVGANGSRGTVAFGNRHDGLPSVLVGEHGTTDTDRLWLHGRNGLVYSADHPLTVQLRHSYASPVGFNFLTPVSSRAAYVATDPALNQQSAAVNQALDLLGELSGISYRLRLPEDMAPMSGEVLPPVGGGNGPQGGGVPSGQSELSLDQDSLHYGLSLESVMQTLPELVTEDEDGVRYVDYNSIVSLLVVAVNELKGQVDELTQQVGMQQAANAPARSPMHTAANADVADGLAVAALHQNIPNPFSADTHIRYCLPESVQQADLYVYDMQGHQVKKIAVAGRGESSVTIHGSELQAGMYIYALIADGQEVDTKRMILTK